MMEMKNAILITIDALRADHLSCLGYHRKTTPQLDEIAKHGILFKNAISNGASTPTSFRPILTSTYHSMYNDDRYLSKYRLTIQEALKRHGYSTAAFHSNPYLSGYFGYNRGFDTFVEISDFKKGDLFKGIETKGFESLFHKFLFEFKLMKFKLKKLYKFSKGEVYAKANTLNEKAIAWLKEHPEKFFIWLHYMDVHTPYTPPKEYLKLFSSSSYNVIKNLKFYLKIKRNIMEKFSEKDLELLIDLYDAEIRYVDTEIGLLLDELRKMGILHETLIIITSDHGEEFFEHGVFGHTHQHLYDELLRVPLIIYAPEIDENSVIEEQVELLSIAPTIVDILGLKRELDNFMGMSLLPIIKGEGEGSKSVISEASRSKISYRTPEWKFILNKETKEYELYNLHTDPNERENIAEREKDKVKEFKKRIIDHEAMMERERIKRKIRRLRGTRWM